MSRSRRWFLFNAGSASLCACTVGQDFVSPVIGFPPRYQPEADAAPLTRGNERWWEGLNDQVLNRVVEAGLAQNLDIRAAAARIEQAEAQARIAGYPVHGGISAQQGGRLNDDYGGGDLGFLRADATWQLDLWGELRRSREAAGYRLDAAWAGRDAARLLLLSSIISAYVDLRYAQELVRINLRVTESREETYKATRELFSQGKTGELEVAQAKSILDFVRAGLPESKIFFVRSLHRIIALLGEMPQIPRRELNRAAPQPLPRNAVPKTGVPADLVRNRPDIIIAERQLAAATADAGAAEAQIYPSFRLIGNVNATLAGSADPAGNVALLFVSAPIFDQPARRTRVVAARARAAELRLLWEKEVVEAVEEVSTTLFSLQNHAVAERRSNETIKSVGEVLRLARGGYADGKVPFLQVLDAERSLLTAENARAEDRRNLALDFARLHVALGGSFGPRPG